MTLAPLFHIDILAGLMLAMVGFISLTVASFAWRYLKGDTQQGRFFVTLTLLVAAVATLVCADHILLLFAAWLSSNLLLVKLMVHKKNWRAAAASGELALRNFALGAVFLLAGLALLYYSTGLSSVQSIIATSTINGAVTAALVLLLLAAMTQSAIWPFHRWLLSSLNSPTPVSAIMHAGLINGGGFLLIRFAPLYSQSAELLNVIFVLGLGTAFVGTLWKLMQHDVKRMLACSTMGQMGFMVAQCGLGLFAGAATHIIWHGLFKAYLFLASGSAAQEKRLDLAYPPSILSFIAALLCGVGAGLAFIYVTNTPIVANSALFLVLLATLAGSQFALALLRQHPLKYLPLALLASIFMGALYAGNVMLIENMLTPMALMQPQPLNLLHMLGMALLTLAWLALIWYGPKKASTAQWQKQLYVQALNASQPHAATITAHRNHYHTV